MQKRLKLALCALLAAALSVMLWQAMRPPGPAEPLYQGKPLSEWLKAYQLTEAMRMADLEAQQQKADEAVRHAGTNALPTLLRMLRAKDSALKIQFMHLARRQNIFRIQCTPADERNDAALRAFKVLGVSAQSVVPALIEIADQDISPVSHYSAIDALGCIGPAASEAVPALLQWATNGDPTLRWHAMNALGEIGAEPDRVVPVLINGLRDPNTRPSAAFALGKFGPDAKPAIAALTVFLDSRKDTTDKSVYTNALKLIDTEAAAKAGLK